MANEVPADEKKIGDEGRPVRVMSFAGGGFDTVFQIGVIHALLVSRGKPPDVVAGISQGAVNAVALAEVMHAGEDAPPSEKEPWTPEQRRAKLAARVSSFRKLFEAARNSYEELRAALRPDTYQIDTAKPLESLKLPIHSARERIERSKTLQARRGLVNLYNEVFRLRLSVGTITRFVRRYLGLRAAAEVRPWIAKRLLQAVEIVRLWVLFGNNIPWLAPLVPTLIRALRKRPPRASQGESAGRILFHSRILSPIANLSKYLLSLVILLVFWLALTSVVFVFVWGCGAMLMLMVRGASLRSAVGDATEVLQRLIIGLIAVLLVYGAAVMGRCVASRFRSRTSGLRRHEDERTILGTTWRAVRDAMQTSLNLVSLFVAWSLSLGLALWLLHLVWVQTLNLIFTLNLSFWRILPAIQLVMNRLFFCLFLEIASLAIAAYMVFSYRKLLIGLLIQKNLNTSLFSSHPLRQLLIRAFDPTYYGEIDLDRVVEAALNDERRPQNREVSGKELRAYSADDRYPQIEVAIQVADVHDGSFKVIDGSRRVVDALLAAVAVTPIFPPECPEKIGSKDTKQVDLCIDAANIANKPNGPLLEHLRERVLREASGVHLYGVSGLPVSRRQLEPEDGSGKRKEFSTLIDVVLRALTLERFRDATLERRLIELYSRTMPSGSRADDPAGRKYLRTRVLAVEPDRPLNLNVKLLLASPGDRRRLIAETVADGCRSALEAMIQPAIQRVAGTASEPAHVSCRSAVKNHLEEAAKADGVGFADEDFKGIPGCEQCFGPGLAEVCQYCAVFRPVQEEETSVGTRVRGSSPASGTGSPSAEAKGKYSLCRRDRESWPEWPVEHQKKELPSKAPDYEESPFQKKTVRILKEWGKNHDWPRHREISGRPVEGKQRPLVSLLFSGGVFRGVFQMGVLNALSELNLKPDIIAGASVGSLTAAMVASAFGIEDIEERRGKIARLCATYLAIDRLILTDRFSDFVRELTIRAGQTRFSLRDLDRVFRKFDSPLPLSFSSESRKVIAGIERLLYISPFELRDLLNHIRREEYHKVAELLADYTQEFLDRGGVSQEILGAEPLALLINEHVIKDLLHNPGGLDPEDVPLDVFLDRSGIYFLATATNLTQGRLEVLGGQWPEAEGRPPRPTLLNALLASSAFPGVFRPRWSWEVLPGSGGPDQFVDGGVMDNLPLDAVAQFLNYSSRAGLIQGRPMVNDESKPYPVPHLVFAASLEPKLRMLEAKELEELKDNWPRLKKRAGTLCYNRKLETYAKAQRDLRSIVRQRMKEEPVVETWDWVPLDLEVVTVAPEWLCGTFAFHPMLGFSRKRQAASIAHGCFSTFNQLKEFLGKPEGAQWISGWGINEDDLRPSPSGEDELVEKSSRCWCREHRKCPFSRSQLKLKKLQLGSRTVKELCRVHELCGRPETHKASH